MTKGLNDDIDEPSHQSTVNDKAFVGRQRLLEDLLLCQFEFRRNFRPKGSILADDHTVSLLISVVHLLVTRTPENIEVTSLTVTVVLASTESIRVDAVRPEVSITIGSTSTSTIPATSVRLV